MRLPRAFPFPEIFEVHFPGIDFTNLHSRWILPSWQARISLGAKTRPILHDHHTNSNKSVWLESQFLFLRNVTISTTAPAITPSIELAASVTKLCATAASHMQAPA